MLTVKEKMDNPNGTSIFVEEITMWIDADRAAQAIKDDENALGSGGCNSSSFTYGGDDSGVTPPDCGNGPNLSTLATSTNVSLFGYVVETQCRNFTIDIQDFTGDIDSGNQGALGYLNQAAGLLISKIR
jgi:hypothetical protein